MSSILSTTALVLGLATAAACAMPGSGARSPGPGDSSPHAVSSRRGPPRAADHVVLSTDATPRCPFTDLGRVEARTPAELRRQAHLRGADGVFDLRSDRNVDVDVRLKRTIQYDGRAVRFDGASCRQ